MGTVCSHCSNCESNLTEEDNELYSRSSTKKKNNYKDNIPTIIFLQLKIKKFLNKLKQDSDQKNLFYKRNYGINELSNDNLDIISEKNEFNSNEADINSKKEDLIEVFFFYLIHVIF